MASVVWTYKFEQRLRARKKRSWTSFQHHMSFSLSQFDAFRPHPSSNAVLVIYESNLSLRNAPTKVECSCKSGDATSEDNNMPSGVSGCFRVRGICEGSSLVSSY